MSILLLMFVGMQPAGSDQTLDNQQWIVFGSFRGGDFSSSILKVSADGGKETSISKHPGGKPNSMDPSICPDGRILFTRGNASHQEEIWIMDGDGGNERRLTGPAGKRWAGSHSVPTLSPDGKMLLYVKAGSRRGDTTVMVRPLEGGEPKSLGPGRYPAWSPDGKIGFMRSVNKVDELFVMANLEAEPVRLTHGRPVRSAGRAVDQHDRAVRTAGHQRSRPDRRGLGHQSAGRRDRARHRRGHRRVGDRA